MERGEFRSFSSPPYYPSSSFKSLFPPRVFAVKARDEKSLSPFRRPLEENNTTNLTCPSTFPRRFTASSPCPDSGGSSSSSWSFAPAFSATESTFHSPPVATSTTCTANCSPPSPYSPLSTVRSRATVRNTSGREFVEASLHQFIAVQENDVYLCPSETVRSQPPSSLGDYSSENTNKGHNSARSPEYFLASEEDDSTRAISRSHTRLRTIASFAVGFDKSSYLHEHTGTVDGRNAKSIKCAPSTLYLNQLPCPVAFSSSAARRCSVQAIHSLRADRSAVASERRDLAAVVEQLSFHSRRQLQQDEAGWRHYAQPKAAMHHYVQQQLSETPLPQPPWRCEDGCDEPQEEWSREFWQQNPRREELQQPPHGYLQQRLRAHIAFDRRRDNPAGLQQSNFTFPPRASAAERQLLQERARLYCMSYLGAPSVSKQQSSSVVSLSDRLDGENESGGELSCQREIVSSRLSCAGSFPGPAFAATLQHDCNSLPRAMVRARPQVMQGHELHRLRRQSQQKPLSQQKNIDEKTIFREIEPRDWRIICVCTLLIIDVIIIGSTATQHAVNPASLIDKLLLTHVSFSASLCTLSAGPPAAVAECLASAASGNAAAAAAAADYGEGRRSSLSLEENARRQRVELPQLQEKLLREPYLSLEYASQLPHSLKRELGLSCVCGWAALFVLGLLSLWVAVRDRFLAARIFPSAISPPEAHSGRRNCLDKTTTSECSSVLMSSCGSRDAGYETCNSSRSPSSSQYSSGRSAEGDEFSTFPCSCEAGRLCSSRGTTCLLTAASGTGSSSSTVSMTNACICNTSAYESEETLVMSSKNNRVSIQQLRRCRARQTGKEPYILCPRRRRQAAADGDGECLKAAEGRTDRRRGDLGKRRKEQLADAYSGETATAHLREYEETVLREYQAGVVAEARARFLSYSLFALLIFFLMNFIMQLTVRCHRTKYQFCTTQSAAAATRGGSKTAVADEGTRRSGKHKMTAEELLLHTTPNTPLLPLELQLHAQRPAAASSAFFIVENEGKDSQQHSGDEEEAVCPFSPEEDAAAAAMRQQAKKSGRLFDEQEPPTSPSHLYYRDYQFWYQLLADSCRDVEMVLSVGCICLHIAAAIACRTTMRKAEERVRAALHFFWARRTRKLAA